MTAAINSEFEKVRYLVGIDILKMWSAGADPRYMTALISPEWEGMWPKDDGEKVLWTNHGDVHVRFDSEIPLGRHKFRRRGMT